MSSLVTSAMWSKAFSLPEIPGRSIVLLYRADQILIAIQMNRGNRSVSRLAEPTLIPRGHMRCYQLPLTRTERIRSSQKDVA